MSPIAKGCLGFTLLLALPACYVGVDDGRYPTGSSSILSTADYASVVTANTDSGTISLLDVETGAVEELEVGGEPTRLARTEDRLLVTLRSEGQLAVVDASGDELRVVDRIPTGTEPYGVVAAEDGSVAYVAASTEGLVHELDLENLEIQRSFPVDGEPRWLALHPSGNALYVGSAFEGLITTVDLRDGSTDTIVPPAVTGFDADQVEVTYSPRITGDLAVSPNGRWLAVPTLSVDNITKGPDMGSGGASLSAPGAAYYAENSGARFRPTIAAIPIELSGQLTLDEAEHVELRLVDTLALSTASYASSVVFSPDGQLLVAPLQGSSSVAVISTESIGSRPSNGLGGGGRSGAFTPSIFAQPNVVLRAEPDSGVRGVTFTDEDRVFVDSFFAHRVDSVSLGDPDEDTSGVRSLIATVEADPSLVSGTVPRSFVNPGVYSNPEGLVPRTVPAGTVVSAPSYGLPSQIAIDELERGRALFFSTEDSAMVVPGAGVSCATCHFESRTDGLTWPFSDPFGPRQTPSLAGEVSLTAPVTWDSLVSSVAAEAIATSTGRMGGEGPSTAQAVAIQAYVDWTPEVIRPSQDTEAVVRGQAVFEREDVGCAGCHSGPMYTDNLPYSMYELDTVVTRSLVGIGSTAPYLHDGSAETLRELLLRLRDGSMGDTSTLSNSEIDDLETFLLSL